ncbi:MAG: hypothetical protein IPL22_16745 [Bacteroidetes bacterium]|nr:hypothetical protein [Bacteroidota bacterium]
MLLVAYLGMVLSILISFQINIHGPASATPGVIDLIYGPAVGTISTLAAIGIENAIGGTNNYLNALTGNGTSTTASLAKWKCFSFTRFFLLDLRLVNKQ